MIELHGGMYEDRPFQVWETRFYFRDNLGFPLRVANAKRERIHFLVAIKPIEIAQSMICTVVFRRVCGVGARVVV